MSNSNPGCLGLLLGWSSAKGQVENSKSTKDDGHEGNIHSGPGGYEGMGYEGGYAADYFATDEHDEQ